MRAEREARTNPEQRPKQRAIAWTLLEIKAADRESVGLSTGLALETSEGVQILARRARVSASARIAAAVAEARGEKPHQKKLGKAAGDQNC